MPSKNRIIFTIVFLLGIVAVSALMQSASMPQQIPAIEVSCPAGATAIPQLVVVAPSGKLRQLACMDSSGNIIFPSTGLGTFGFSGTVLTVGTPSQAAGSIVLIGVGSGATLSASPAVTLGNNTLGWSGSGASLPGIVSSGAISLTGTGACATYSATAGGNWAGSGTCSGTTGAATVVITPGTTAPHFWGCFGADITPAHLLTGVQTGFSATNCTLNFTSVTSTDNVQITAFAY